MITKTQEREQAIALRRQGFTYSEILRMVHVAKSTLALWLQSVELAKHQVQRITEKKLDSARRGALAKKQKRIVRQEEIYSLAEQEIGTLSLRELWLIGIAFYWAEGSKEKESYPGSRMKFSNSDPAMLRLWLRWLLEIGHVQSDDIDFEIYIHENHKPRIGEVREFWSHALGVPMVKFQKVYYKRHNPRTLRKNVGDAYHGQIIIVTRRSSSLLRMITGWARGIDKSIGGWCNGNTVGFEPTDSRSDPWSPSHLGTDSEYETYTQL